MRRFSQRNSLVTLSDINITPLLDLAFVLLIIFIIISSSITTQPDHGMQLNLPQGGGPTLRQDPKNIRVVSVDQHGNYMLGNRPSDLEQIENALAAEQHSNPHLIVRVRVDENGLNKHSFAVIDLCQRRGFPLQIDTKPDPSRRR